MGILSLARERARRWARRLAEVEALLETQSTLDRRELVPLHEEATELVRSLAHVGEELEGDDSLKDPIRRVAGAFGAWMAATPGSMAERRACATYAEEVARLASLTEVPRS